MIKKTGLLIYVFLLIIFLFSPAKTFAENIAVTSATLHIATSSAEDVRVKVLKAYLIKQSSPLVPFAEDFVQNADTYNLDWRLVAAISGLESTFGQQIPYNSYNGWGWGIYGDNVIRFSSWVEGIKTVSKGLREDYINKWKATDVYQIGALYAASPTWAYRVAGIMNSIQEFALTNFKDGLSLSL